MKYEDLTKTLKENESLKKRLDYLIKKDEVAVLDKEERHEMYELKSQLSGDDYDLTDPREDMLYEGSPLEDLFKNLSKNDQGIVDLMLEIDNYGEIYEDSQDEACAMLRRVYSNHEDAMFGNEDYIDDIYCDDEKQVISNFTQYLDSKKNTKDGDDLVENEKIKESSLLKESDIKVGDTFKNKQGATIKVVEPTKAGGPQFNFLDKDGKPVDCRGTDSYKSLEKILKGNGYEKVNKSTLTEGTNLRGHVYTEIVRSIDDACSEEMDTEEIKKFIQDLINYLRDTAESYDVLVEGAKCEESNLKESGVTTTENLSKEQAQDLVDNGAPYSILFDKGDVVKVNANGTVYSITKTTDKKIKESSENLKENFGDTTDYSDKIERLFNQWWKENADLGMRLFKGRPTIKAKYTNDEFQKPLQYLLIMNAFFVDVEQYIDEIGTYIADKIPSIEYKGHKENKDKVAWKFEQNQDAPDFFKEEDGVLEYFKTVKDANGTFVDIYTVGKDTGDNKFVDVNGNEFSEEEKIQFNLFKESANPFGKIKLTIKESANPRSDLNNVFDYVNKDIIEKISGLDEVGERHGWSAQSVQNTHDGRWTITLNKNGVTQVTSDEVVDLIKEKFPNIRPLLKTDRKIRLTFDQDLVDLDEVKDKK